jgi:hypothetical protein
VFPDGPPPTGERHCLNSVPRRSLKMARHYRTCFNAAPEGLPDSADASLDLRELEWMIQEDPNKMARSKHKAI